MGHYTGVRGMFWWVTILESEVCSDGSLYWSQRYVLMGHYAGSLRLRVRGMIWWVTMLESEVCSDGALCWESESQRYDLMGHYARVRGMFWWVTILESEVCSDGSLCWGQRYGLMGHYAESDICSDGSLCWSQRYVLMGHCTWSQRYVLMGHYAETQCNVLMGHYSGILWNVLMGRCSGTPCNVPMGHYSGSQMYVPMPILPLGHYFVCWKFRHTKYTQIVWVKRSATAWIRIWTLWTLNPASYPHGLWCHLAHLHTVKVASICQVEATLWTSVDLDVSNSIGISGT